MSKRDPVTHRTPEQIKQHRKERNTPEYRAKQRARAQNRRDAVKEGRVRPGDGKDLAHKKAMSRGGAKTDPSNIRVESAAKNRGHGMSKNGSKPSARVRRLRKGRIPS